MLIGKVIGEQTNEKKTKYVVLSLVLCLSMMLFLCGCGEEKSGSTIEEPEITGKYLQEDYSQQLLNDGAETVVGYVTLDKLGKVTTVYIFLSVR